ncbi:Ribosomal L22e protein [Tilletia horrida]|uniref:Ribosomal L22e protein n=1 Tax=Tilletia horrida TaxID=155126 RepID=A0AAN6GGB8_9BASI|nr:Ribosomal L22e protein [Tilletia horrida]KAK0536730.1 Ribosomal L22e protein [Tilletia horrida]KAK0539672.1 Ribosomal L22e protein [Tilletia horrida]KAK0564193.1 Ribosomal L22e protein [Tilletia horrida]
MAVGKIATGGRPGAKSHAKVGETFFIDFSGPANDGVFDAAGFERFLHEKIKVDGKAGALGDDVKITREGEQKVIIKTTIPFSKRYLKYLTKKFLKRSQLRDWLRVVATSKDGFEIKFFNVSMGAEEEE